MTSYIEAVEKRIDQHNKLPIRLKELEDRNKELTLQLLATSGQAADALAKTVKAVEALREIETDCDADYPPSHGAIKHFAIATLAEIKGGNDAESNL